MNYERDILIDETSLDIEWLEQSALFMKYAKHSAEALRDFDDVKQNLDVLKGELDKSIRENPSNFGIEKVTEGAIQSAILTDKGYQAMYEELLNAKYENDMARNAVVAFNMRKDALENLVKLHGQSYFSGPKVPHNLTELKQEREKKVESRIGQTFKRTR